MAEEGWHARQADIGRTLMAAFAASAAAPAALILIGSIPSGFENPAAFFLVLGFGMLWGGGLALLHALLLGVPAYLLLSRLVTPRWWMCGLGGAMIGGVPILIYWLLTSPDTINEAFPMATMFGAAGMVGGLIFGWIMARGRSFS